MEAIDALDKPCPIPVIEAKKALAKQEVVSVLVKVSSFAAVQNLEKMAEGYGYGFTYEEKSNSFEVIINRDGKEAHAQGTESIGQEYIECGMPARGLIVVIGRDTMGEGSEELGKILIKGFIYSLSELNTPPVYVIFLNSGAFLTTSGSNTVDDLKKLEEKGTKILTCGTCANYYGLQDKLVVGSITDMYGITEKMASASNVINI